MHIKSFTISRHSLKKPSPLVHLHEGRRRMHKRRPTCKSDYDMVSILHLDCKCKQCNPTALKQARQPDLMCIQSSGQQWMDGSKRWAAKSRLLLFSDAHTGSHTHTLRRSTQCYLSQLGALMEQIVWSVSITKLAPLWSPLCLALQYYTALLIAT